MFFITFCTVIVIYTEKSNTEKMTKKEKLDKTYQSRLFIGFPRTIAHKCEVALKELNITEGIMFYPEFQFILLKGCIFAPSQLNARLKGIINKLVRKYRKPFMTLTIKLEEYMLFDKERCIAMTPKRDSIDWYFLCELQGTLSMNRWVNRAHPRYCGPDKIEIGEGSPWFKELYDACMNGESIESASKRLITPYMSVIIMNNTHTNLCNTHQWVTGKEISIDVMAEMYVETSIKGTNTWLKSHLRYYL